MSTRDEGASSDALLVELTDAQLLELRAHASALRLTVDELATVAVEQYLDLHEPEIPSDAAPADSSPSPD